MFILTIRTDKPEAEIGLFDDDRQIDYQTWEAHRLLAETVHTKIRDMLTAQKIELKDIQGLVVYRGPGSFTGLRIGISLANALADSLRIPVAGSSGADWLQAGRQKIQQNQNDKIVTPQYGAPPHVTEPKK